MCVYVYVYIQMCLLSSFKIKRNNKMLEGFPQALLSIMCYSNTQQFRMTVFICS